MKYRLFGKEKRLALDVYPIVTLKEAREKRDAARKLIAEDIDPVQVKNEAKRIKKLNADNTFETIAREWHEHKKAEWTPRHAKTILTRLEADIFPEIGKLPIKSINTPTLLNVIRKIELEGLTKYQNVVTNIVVKFSVMPFKRGGLIMIIRSLIKGL